MRKLLQSWEVNKHMGNGEGREDCDVSSDILIPFSLPLGLSMPFACCPVHLCGTHTLLSLAVGSIPSTAAAMHFMGMCLSECLPGALLRCSAGKRAAPKSFISGYRFAGKLSRTGQFFQCLMSLACAAL